MQTFLNNVVVVPFGINQPPNHHILGAGLLSGGSAAAKRKESLVVEFWERDKNRNPELAQ